MNIINFNGATVISKFWTDFKSLALINKGLSVQYEEDLEIYDIFAVDGNIIYETVIYKGEVPAGVLPDYSQEQNDADKADFTTNFQSIANKANLSTEVLVSNSFVSVSNALVSTDNSTTTILSSNGIFTGTSEEVSKDYSSITVNVIASSVSAVVGLTLQFSKDNTTWFTPAGNAYYYYTPDVNQTFTSMIHAKYFRVVYTNGASTQTSFNLQTIYSKQPAQIVVVGERGEGTTDDGNPVKIGFKSLNGFAGIPNWPAAAYNNKRVSGLADQWGRQLVTNIDRNLQRWKVFNATIQQTGTEIVVPSSGVNGLAITSVIVSVSGITSGKMTLWFGSQSDLSYTAGVDQVLIDSYFAPSSTSAPGMVLTPPNAIFCNGANLRLKITTSAAMTVSLVIYYFEW